MEEEQFLYPAIALIYFALLSWESRGERLVLGIAASVNVFFLFVLAQPLCLFMGGYQGVAIYLAVAMMSYASLPRREKKKAKRDENKRECDKNKNHLKKSKETKAE